MNSEKIEVNILSTPTGQESEEICQCSGLELQNIDTCDVFNGYVISSWSLMDRLLNFLSIVYAQLLVVLCTAVLFAELVNENVPLFHIHRYIFMYLLSVGNIILIGEYVSLSRWACSQPCNKRDNEAIGKETFINSSRNTTFFEMSLYMKILIFGFGSVTVIFCSLKATSMFLMTEECADVRNVVQPVLCGVFVTLQMFLLLTKLKELFNYSHGLKKIIFLHLIATNLALWIQALLLESAQDWTFAKHIIHNSSMDWENKKINITLHTLEFDINSSDESKHKPIHGIHFTSHCWWRIGGPEKIEDLIAFKICLQNSAIGSVLLNSTAYLYPFIIQYFFVTSGIMSVIWMYFHYNSKIQYWSLLNDIKFYSKKEWNCQRSTKGLFLGVIVLFFHIVVALISFIRPAQENTLTVHNCVQFATYGLATLSVFFGLFQIKKIIKAKSYVNILSVVFHQITFLASFLHAVLLITFSGIEISNSDSVLVSFNGIIKIIQICSQTFFIQTIIETKLDESSKKKKPARQVVIFLGFCNIAFCLSEYVSQYYLNSWLPSKPDVNITWSVIMYIIFPFVMFYRFYSTVLFLEVWSKLYN